jgi:hypothetical protein
MLRGPVLMAGVFVRSSISSRRCERGGRFCLLDVPPDAAWTFASEKPLLVRAYGVPVVTNTGVCLKRATFFTGDRRYTTTIIEYGPNGHEGFSEAEAAKRDATRIHPEERLLTRFGYRVLAGVHVGKTNFDDSPAGVGWSVAAELDLRLALRTELALLAGLHAYPEFGAPTSIQTALLFRYYVVGIGAALGRSSIYPCRTTRRSGSEAGTCRYWVTHSARGASPPLPAVDSTSRRTPTATSGSCCSSRWASTATSATLPIAVSSSENRVAARREGSAVGREREGRCARHPRQEANSLEWRANSE